jgi:hypothetical protein
VLGGVYPLIGQRHPDDPDPRASTKAAAVWALGLTSIVTGPFVGGIIPATIGLLLARQARADLAAAGGYLTGAHRLRRGQALALIGLGLAATTLVALATAALIAVANGAIGHDFPDSVH